MFSRTLSALATCFLMVSGAQGALIDRGGGLIFDDVLGITWTQDADINGRDTWDTQVAWAASLSFSQGGETYDDWRLATSREVPFAGSFVDCSTVSEVTCRNNELGYMFYQNGVTAATPGLFANLQPDSYWSGTQHFNTNPFVFAFSDGSQTVFLASNLARAWAVRSGDVAAVPEPTTVWLLGSVLGLLGWLRRKA